MAAELISLVEPQNAASVRVLEKLGLQYVGLVQYRGSPAAKYAVEKPGTS